MEPSLAEHELHNIGSSGLLPLSSPKARSSGKKCKGPAVTYHQRQHARATALSRQLVINQDVDTPIKVIENEARQLSKNHYRSVAWFQHQFFQGGHATCQKYAVNVLMWPSISRASWMDIKVVIHSMNHVFMS
jgi:hypothetical protein